MMKVLLYWTFLLVLLPYFLEKHEASKIHFQTFDMSPDHLSSDIVCNRASKTGFRNRLPSIVLEVVHRQNPCAKKDDEKSISSVPSSVNDQLRAKPIFKPVDSINTYNNTNNSNRDRKAKLPAKQNPYISYSDYIVTIGLGTPKQNINLEFDTGSSITWTQCQPCTGHCYPQKEPIFNPFTSSTYSTISCKSKDCPQGIFQCDCSDTCLYDETFGDGSYTKGFLSKDNLILSPTNVFQGFLFGCGQNNSGTFTGMDGVLGLNRGERSIVSQMRKKYGRFFSYCLPSNKQTSGFLAFGKTTKKDDDERIIFTPFVPTPEHQWPFNYYIEITVISVGGAQLAINQSVFRTAGTIIDSGTAYTSLPPMAYSAMRKKFKKNMRELNYTSAPAFNTLDTCFHISQHTNITKVPTVSFTFKGNATINLDPSGILTVVNSTYICLAFEGNTDPSDLAILGNHQQMNFEVRYDVEGGKLGFIHNPHCQ